MARQPRSLSGLVVAVTGGARGIGRATARACVDQGMKVAIGDLDPELAAATASELGAGAVGLPLDVTSRDSFDAFLDAVEERHGPLDVLVNNAGIMQLSPFVEEDDASAIRQVDINLHGVITGSKLALRRFLSRRTGHLVNIASSAGKYGAPGGATYSATKHAVVGLSEAIRAEVRGSGVEISCVMPGVVRTELSTGLVDTRGVKVVGPEDVAQAIVGALQVPLFDVYVPKQIGSVVRFNALMPRRVNELIGRALKADQVLAAADAGARKGYELRAARSEPQLDAGDGQPALPTGDQPVG